MSEKKDRHQIITRLTEAVTEQQSVYVLRSAIVQLVDYFFLDLDDASQALQTSGKTSEYFSSLQLCLLLITEKPDIFLQLSFHGPDSTSLLTENKSKELNHGEKMSVAFCTWLMHRFLRLLSREECSMLHPTCVSVLTQILRTARSHSDHAFRQLVDQLVRSCTELLHLISCLENGEVAVKLSALLIDLDTVKLSLVDPSGNMNESQNMESIRDEVLELTNVRQCQCLQTNLVKVLTPLVADMKQHEALRVTLYETMLICIVIGELQLKVVSLEMLIKLLSECSIVDHLVAVIVEMLNLLLTTNTLLPQEAIQLEGPMARLLDSKDSVLYTKLTSSHYMHIFTAVSSQLALGGLNRFATVELRRSLLRFLCHCLDHSSRVEVLSIGRVSILQIVSLLMGYLSEKEADLQSIVPLLCHLILLEAGGASSVDAWPQVLYSPSSTLQPFPAAAATPGQGRATTQSQAAQTPSRLKMKRREMGSQVEAKKRRIQLFEHFVDKVWELLDREKNETTCLVRLCACRCLSEVAARCALKASTSTLSLYAASDFMSREVTQKLCLCLSSSLLDRVILSNERAACEAAVRHVAHSASAFLLCNDLAPLPFEIFQDLMWMLSLPWLMTDRSQWRDLQIQQEQAVVSLSQDLSGHLSSETVCLCLHGLAFAPAELCPDWRAHVFTLALADSQDKVRERAIGLFPLLLYTLGKDWVHLIRDCLHPLLESDCPESVQLAVSTVLPDLVCVAAGTTWLDRLCIKDADFPLQDLAKLKCSACAKKAEKLISNEVIDDGLHPRQIEPKLFVPFLSLIKSPSAAVRKNMVQRLQCLFHHIPVRPHNHTTVSMLKASLCLIEDPDNHIRLLFSRVVGSLLSVPLTPASDATRTPLSATDKLIMESCQAACAKACCTRDNQLLETVLLTVGQLARHAEGELLKSALLMLLENRLSFIPVVAAYDELFDVAIHKQTTQQQLFSKFRPAFSKFLVEAMLEAQSLPQGSSAQDILQKSARALGFPNIKSLLQGCEKHMLPIIVSRASSESSSLIRLLSTLLSVTNRRKLITNSIKDIFTFLICHCQKPDLEKALDYLQKETDFSLGSLLRMDFQRVHNELLLRLSMYDSQVFSGLQILSTYDEQNNGPVQTREQMAEYLEPRLLGVLAFFDAQLVNSNITLADKKLALESLISIIQLMGSKHISSIRHKVVNTLRLGLNFKDVSLMEVSCRAWNCFVHSLELPLLGQMLFQIVATLLPLLLQMPRQVADIINFMVVDCRAELQQYFHEIYFLPDLPELADPIAVLKHYTDNPFSQTDVQEQLVHCIKGARHESLDVRTHALSRLRRLLREKRLPLYDLILGNESAEPVISQLVSVLLHGCQETDQNIRSLYGQCLGELGALDPGRLQLISSDPREDHAKLQATVDEDHFVVGLINEVIKAFLAATEPRIQDCSAFALQELLQIYKMHPPVGGEPETRGNKLWKSISEQNQEILAPLLNTKYKLSVDKSINFPKPIYGSQKGHNLLDWVNNWMTSMCSKVKYSLARQVFNACSAAKRHSLQIALYLLPQVILQVLLNSSNEDHLEIYNEGMEVIAQAQKADTRHSSASDLRHMGAQTIFSVLDYLTRWRTHRILNLTVPVPMGKVPDYSSDVQLQAVSSFLLRIPKDTLAQASYNCKAYTRALMHFEQYLQDSKQNIQEHLDFLQRLYVCLNESDGVVGVAAIRKAQPTLLQEVMIHESLGHQQDAQACYVKALQVSPDELTTHQGFISNLMEMGQVNIALLHTSGILADCPQWLGQLNQYRVEAAWKMCNWNSLDTMMALERSSNNSWPVCIGRLLIAARCKKEEEFVKQLEVGRQQQLSPLSAASMELGSYHRGYECILRLHMLSEIEDYFHVIQDFPAVKEDVEPSSRRSMGSLLSQWEARLQMVQSSFRIQEPILTLRRTLLSLSHRNSDPTVDNTIGRWWLKSAKIARKAGYLQTAYSCLLQAGTFDLPELFIEKAKWLWEKGERDSALLCLEKCTSHQFPTVPADRDSKQVYAQALLLYGRYCEETSNLESNEIVKRYKNVIEICPEWEMGHFQLAQYYERIMGIVAEKDRPEKYGEFATSMIRYFGNALRYGNHHIYQAMPKMLSLWLDYGATCCNIEQREKANKGHLQKLAVIRTHLTKMNKIMQQYMEWLAPYQFFSAFPQLVSRICHAQPEVSQILQELIARLLASFPQQAMWMMMAVSKSSYAVRSRRCHEIFAAARQKNRELEKLLSDGIKLTERLIEVCDKECKNVASLSMSTHFKTLKRMTDDPQFSQILLPLQSAMTVTLPPSLECPSGHNPFPGHQVFIRGLEDTIEICASLSRPKKVTMVGSDGKLYIMMCKPKDDLRKDCRLMEFNMIVNRFLHRDAESRSRQLHLRTYTVTPLNEECGLLEWVNNTHGLRNIIIRLYREKGTMMSSKELRTVMPPLNSDVETKLKVYKEQLLARHPLVFKEWFLRTFPDPTAWYNARTAYARTCAVMSMIGYVLGLGDRHGENILFDSTNGDTVHVDFNCLFNRGETFEWPERVPFRLTPNMVSALGPMGVEGIFRRACEVTLRVIREQTDSLMSILKPFIYDPLVEWSKAGKDKRSHTTETGEISNEQALTHVQNIEDRLRGILKSNTKPRGLPLSIEGHVKNLIQEATDERLLCQMYVGWAAYM